MRVYTELDEAIDCYLRSGIGAMVGGAGAVAADLVPFFDTATLNRLRGAKYLIAALRTERECGSSYLQRAAAY